VLAIGAPDEAGTAGRVHVFRRSGTTWSPEAVLQPVVPVPPAPNADQFGFAVAVDRGHVVVGARGEDCGARGIDQPCGVQASSSGAAYFFRKTGATWTQEAYAKSSNAVSLDQFGTSVAVDGDTFAVGAPLQDTTKQDSGAVYVFR
jgi:hypothetical protein